MNLSSLGVKIDATAIDGAAAAFDRLTQSIERAVEALQKLSDSEHGGIRITSIGDITEIIIKPVSQV